VALGWTFGWLVFGAPSDREEFRALELDWTWDVVTFAGFLPVLLTAAWLQESRHPIRRVVGHVVAGVGVVALAGNAFLSSFGGICLDPGDTCLVPATAHLAHVVGGAGVVGLAWAFGWLRAASRPASAAQDVVLR
jgi:hypothetical protein